METSEKIMNTAGIVWDMNIPYEESVKSGLIVFAIDTSSQDRVDCKAMTADGQYIVFITVVPKNAEYHCDFSTVRSVKNDIKGQSIEDMIASEQSLGYFMAVKNQDTPYIPIPKQYQEVTNLENLGSVVNNILVNQKTEWYKARVEEIFNTWDNE